MATGGSRKYLLFFVTGPEDHMRELARKLVEEKLAACVNLINGIKSTYWWEGKVSEDTESLLIIKTESSKAQELISFVRSNHPYKVPEVIGLEINTGNPEYLNWILESLNIK
ncbi:MAG: divalent-cation tolerance protein CutA [Zestosphaera sp.]